MPDKDNIDDLYLESLDDDLADFLNEAGSESVKVEEPQEEASPAPAAHVKRRRFSITST